MSFLFDVLGNDLHVRVMSATANANTDAYRLETIGSELFVRVRGDWTVDNIASIDEQLVDDLDAIGYGPDFHFGESLGGTDSPGGVVFCLEHVSRMDTAGAYVLTRALGCHDGFCRLWRVDNATDGQKALVSAAAEASLSRMQRPPRPWYEPLARLGEGFVKALNEIYDTLIFFGAFIATMARLVVRPRRIRWKPVVALIESVGLDAMPIVVILSFFIGAVIAFMGADLLEVLGFKVFVVDLVGFSVLREFGVLITAILLAGRSNSAFTAQIGSMKMRQEIDAMTVIGMDTGETLIAPRAIACLICAPILTFAAMMAGLFGGMLVAWTQDISPILFLARLSEVVDISHFWVGMVKAPVYGLVIAIIGCRHGLAVDGSVESLGARTTTSVVQAIFTVIFLDAVFAMLFLQMGV